MTKQEQQSELFQAQTTWFHVFKDMIDSGDLKNIDGSSLKVYLVIKSYSNFTTGRAFPAIELIAEKSGLSERQVIRCLTELETLGYISKEKTGRHNTYTLREKVSIKDSDGTPQAVATWDYIPSGITDAVAQIKKAVITGEMVGGGTVNIQTLVLNVNIQHGDNSTQINLNGSDEKLPIDIKEKLADMRSALKSKHE